MIIDIWGLYSPLPRCGPRDLRVLKSKLASRVATRERSKMLSSFAARGQCSRLTEDPCLERHGRRSRVYDAEAS